jgi:hypothetical protein
MSAADKLAEEIAEAVVARLRAALPTTTAPEYVDQGTCGFDARTFMRAARAGEFPAAKKGRRWIARKADIDAWLLSSGKVTKADTDLSDLRKKLRRAS